MTDSRDTDNMLNGTSSDLSQQQSEQDEPIAENSSAVNENTDLQSLSPTLASCNVQNVDMCESVTTSIKDTVTTTSTATTHLSATKIQLVTQASDKEDSREITSDIDKGNAIKAKVPGLNLPPTPTGTTVTDFSTSIAASNSFSPRGSITSSTRNADNTTTVTITAGGVTATVTTSNDDTSPVTASSTSVTTAPSTSSRHSSITSPDLSNGVFPLTGVNGRSERLQQLRTTTLDNYILDDEETRIHSLTPLQVTCEGGTGLIFNRPTPATVVRKCVYMYEDKYSFCRVLQPGMLLFDSHFECGNLNSAYLVTSNRDSDRAAGAQTHAFYDLYMNEDVTSTAGAQWFYFSVSGNKSKQKVTFSIRNFYKPESLFNEGMRPLVLSLKGSTTKNGEKRQGWTRTGYNISYRQETQEEFSYNPAPTSNTANNAKRAGAKKPTPSRALKSILTFTHVFEEAQDTCFFAFCHPYSYSDLQTYLYFAESKLEQSVFAATLSPRSISPRYSKVPASKECTAATVVQSDPTLLFYYRTKLCDTLAGNRCDLIVVSSLDNIHVKKDDPSVGTSVSDAHNTPMIPVVTGASLPGKSGGSSSSSLLQPSPPLSRSSSASRRPSPSASTRSSVKISDIEYYPIPGLATPTSVPHIIISARVHPGETTASWSMQGFLDFILSNHLKAQELRSKFIFIIIPMLNPDGVINGNNRTSLSGHDLNRNWRCPDAKKHPTIYNLKELTQNLVDKTSHDVLLYLDLHGHSRQKGAFTYGCLPDRNDISQIRDFFSAAAASTSTLPRTSTGTQSTATLPTQNSSKNLNSKTENTPPIYNGKTSAESAKTKTNNNVQNQIKEIQATPHVGTRGILSRGRRRSEDNILNAFLNTDNSIATNDHEQTQPQSPRKGGQLCSTEYEEHDENGRTLETSSSVKSYAPVMLRPPSPITSEKKSAISLEDAKSSMNIDVNFDGYSSNKAFAAYSNRGASLETESDKNAPNSFACGNELETRFGSKEERVKSLPRVFLKKMVSFSQSSCSYKVPTAKLSTSRAVMALEVGIECSYTLEISLAGDNKKLFQPTDLLNIGKAMGKSLHEWMQPALAHLETKRILEEQERVRQEQLEAYYTYNSRNKDRESRAASRAGSRPLSGSTTRSRPHSATVNRVGAKMSSAVISMGDLNAMLYGSSNAINDTTEKPPLSLVMAGHHIKGRETTDISKLKVVTDRSPRDEPEKTVTQNATEKDHPQYVGQKERKDNNHVSRDTTFDHKSQVLTPTLQVRYPKPEYIIDGTEKGDILVSPVHVDAQYEAVHTKKSNSTGHEKVPNLDLSIGPRSASQQREEPNSDASTNHVSGRTKERKGSNRQPLYSPRGDSGDSEEDWDIQLMKQSQSSSSKSPRASVLKDSLKYSQSSKSGDSGSTRTARVVYQQQRPKNSPQLRSESAKSRRSPKMSNSKANEMDWGTRDPLVTGTYKTAKDTTKRHKSASHQRPSRDIVYSNQIVDNEKSSLYVEDRSNMTSDENFSLDAKGILSEHEVKDSQRSPKKNKKVKKELALQLDMLRREYEESNRLLDEEELKDKELNLQSSDPQEVYQESAFSNYSTHNSERSSHSHASRRSNRFHAQRPQPPERQQQPQQSPKGVTSRRDQDFRSNYSFRVDGKKNKA